MRQKTKNHRKQGSFDKKTRFFSPDPKSHTQVGSLCAKNASEKFSRLGTFNEIPHKTSSTKPNPQSANPKPKAHAQSDNPSQIHTHTLLPTQAKSTPKHCQTMLKKATKESATQAEML
jgi:hypothetical protein